MQKVVHQFVDSQQKGFVPDTFIADATMMLHLVEAYINEEPMEREGMMIFLDMEKAFDRCSYKFINGSLKALGFGKRFRTMVRLMYDVDNAPMRRIYALRVL